MGRKRTIEEKQKQKAGQAEDYSTWADLRTRTDVFIFLAHCMYELHDGSVLISLLADRIDGAAIRREIDSFAR